MSTILDKMEVHAMKLTDYVIHHGGETCYQSEAAGVDVMCIPRGSRKAIVVGEEQFFFNALFASDR